MVKIIQKLVPINKYSIKCPYEMTPVGITVHNTANDASALNEIAYMTNNNYEISYHYAVDDIQAVQGLPLNRNGWHASDGGNGTGNRKTIAIEICYSLSGGARFDKAEENAAELIAQLLQEYGWGIDRVKRHYDYAPNKKYCPHRTMDKGWDRFLNMVKSKMSGSEIVIPSFEVTYQIWDDVRNKWLPNVVNDRDYAGIFGHDVCCVYAHANEGNVYYKVHYKGGKWLPQVKNRSDYAGLYNKPIDGFMIKADKKKLTYRVHLRRQNRWLPWVTGYSTLNSNNGYAGIIGQEIDGIQIK